MTFKTCYIHNSARGFADIRPEEFTPSYAGSATRMDFLLPTHSLVIEVKRIRDKAHAARVGDELIVDIEHYHRHPDCTRLWCAVYDPRMLIKNPTGMVSDLERSRSTLGGHFLCSRLGGAGGSVTTSRRAQWAPVPTSLQQAVASPIPVRPLEVPSVRSNPRRNEGYCEGNACHL